MNVDEEVGRLKEEIQRLGQSQPDGSFKVVSAAKKFKISGIGPVLEEKLDDMFSRVVATGPHAFTPSEQGFISLPEVMRTEQVNDSGEGPNQIHREIESTCKSKRPKVKKRKKGATVIRDTIIELVESCTVVPGASQDTFIDDCLRVLDTYPELKAEKELYVNFVKLLEDPTLRQFFMNIDSKFRVNYLRSFMDK